MSLSTRTLRFPFLLLLLGWYSGCGQNTDVAEEKVIRPVRIAKVTATGGTRSRTFSGSSRAGLESRLSFRINGTLERLDVEVGDRVQRGAVVGRLDPKDYQLQADQAKASLAQARAQARNASANYERIRGLYENNNASINDLDSARASRDSSVAQVESLETQLALAESQLSYTQLIAPMDGSIAEVLAEVNENVRAGQTIVTLNAGTLPEISFGVPEQLIRDISQGDSVLVTFDALPGDSYSATITEVGVATRTAASTFPVVARLDKPNNEVRQGMAVEVSITFDDGTDKTQIAVPPHAVAEDRDGRHVYIAEPQEGGNLALVRRRAVETGALMEHGLLVINGLEDGEWIITAGLRFLREGMEVRLPQNVGETL